MKSRQLKKQ
jgi:hypothetical protein